MSHFMEMGLLLSPIIYRCRLKVLCTVSRPTTTTDCVLLKDSNRVPVVRLGIEINCRACLCVLEGPHHYARCCSPSSVSSFLLYSTQRPQKGLRFNEPLNRNTPYDIVDEFISSHSGMSRDPIRPHSVSDRDIIQRLLVPLHQRRSCFSSLKRFQSRLTIRTNTSIYIWPVLRFIFMNAG